MLSLAVRFFLYKKNSTTPRLKIKYNTENNGELGKERNKREVKKRVQERGFPYCTSGKESTTMQETLRDMGSIPESGRSLEKGMATHSSILVWRISMDWGAWRATADGVAKSQTQAEATQHTHTGRETWRQKKDNLASKGKIQSRGLFKKLQCWEMITNEELLTYFP